MACREGVGVVCRRGRLCRDGAAQGGAPTDDRCSVVSSHRRVAPVPPGRVRTNKGVVAGLYATVTGQQSADLRCLAACWITRPCPTRPRDLLVVLLGRCWAAR